MDHLTQTLNRIEAKLQNIENLITGNDTPERGVIVRLDRIEQNAARHLWFSRTSLGAAITVTVGFIVKLIFGHAN